MKKLKLHKGFRVGRQKPKSVRMYAYAKPDGTETLLAERQDLGGLRFLKPVLMPSIL